MTTGYVIRAMGFANGVHCPHLNEYLVSFDHEAHDGRGFGTFSPRLSRAMVFDTRVEAMQFWQKQSTTMPLRPDGEPNRPLTALSISVEPLP